VRSYNEAMTEALVARHGRHRWRRVAQDAVAEAAQRDVDAGNLRIVIYGMPMPSDYEYQRLLKARYGIEMQLGGCVLPSELDMDRYNQRMRAEIERRFGLGVLEKTEQDARLVAERRRQDPDALQCLTAEQDAAVNATE
jgi:hypothetical protein